MKKNKLRVRYISVDAVEDNLSAYYDQQKLAELADSVKAFGVVVPIVVAARPFKRLELISGGRRLAAARLARVPRVPAFVIKSGPPAEAVMALMCDLHRENQNEFRTARLLKDIEGALKLKPDELSAMTGLEDEVVASYKKLLTLTPEQQAVCEAAMCGKEYSDRIAALPASEKNKLFFGLMNEAHPLEERAAMLRERLGCKGSAIPRRSVAIKDVRIFFNTIDRAVDVMQRSGVKAASERHDYEDFTEYLIRIPLDSDAKRA